MIIPVNAENGCYDIVLERGALERVGEIMPLSWKVLVVTDDGVPAEYANTVAAQYANPYVVTLWQGEKNKRQGSLSACFRQLNIHLCNKYINN